ncbi:putative secondary metabolism biosyntheticenzyme [Clathrus columnatus]|uniref:Secondary metabolism biosyntheticenzyme n=1 Tax=Clathrus columnatus TaxID=1419009 RepID=A0AAV5A5Y2_9AGAM|nr:putative secondary metabolism biosyntheticenzyme [Clathrus columnatus]
MSSSGENTIPNTQKAWLVVKRGKPREAVVLKEDHPVPLPLKEGWKLMKLLPNFASNRPFIAENDLSGTISQSNTAEFKPGDAVFGWSPVDLSYKTRLGALCEYIRLPSTYVVHKPDNVDFVEAAGVCLAGMTAYQGIELCELEAGQTVFINGGTTAVGSFAIQIAKAKGCKVVATCSTPNVEIVKNLGADEVIDYKSTPVIQHLQQNTPNPKYHAIYDTVGSSADLYTASPSYLAPNGIYVSVGISTGGLGNMIMGAIKTMFWPSWLGGTKRRFKTLLTKNDKKHLEALRDLMAQGKVKPLVDSTFSFNEVHDAYDRLMTSRAKGKVVVKVIYSFNIRVK